MTDQRHGRTLSPSSIKSGYFPLKKNKLPKTRAKTFVRVISKSIRKKTRDPLLPVLLHV